jgi:hypothetical protein
VTRAEFERLLGRYGLAMSSRALCPGKPECSQGQHHAAEIRAARAAVLAAFDEAMREGSK